MTPIHAICGVLRGNAGFFQAITQRVMIARMRACARISASSCDKPRQNPQTPQTEETDAPHPPTKE
jgi:hypothetical protein